MTEPAPRIGVVGLPGSWSSEAMADAVAECTAFRLLVDMAAVVADLDAGRVLYGEVDLCSLDALVVRKIGSEYGPDMLDRIEILRYVAESGVPVFSKPQSLIRLIDRLSCTLTLRRGGIPMPPTVVTEDPLLAAEAVRRFGTALLKPLFSTKARGIRIATSERDVEEQVRSFQKDGNPVLYVQKKVPLPGRDLGVVFLGGEHVGTYSRVAGEGAWSTSTREGGRYCAHDAPPAVIELARRAQALFDLDFTSVDVVESEDGLVVFEVSAFGGFRGLREGLGIDAAARYADYVVAKLRTG